MSGSDGGRIGLDDGIETVTGDGESVLPAWLPTSFGGFRNLVLGVLGVWVVRRFIDAGVSLTESLLVVWGTFRSIGGTLGDVLEGIAGSAGSIPLELLGSYEAGVVELAASTGPVAPLVVAIAWGVLVVGVVVAIRAAVGAGRLVWEVLPVT